MWWQILIPFLLSRLLVTAIALSKISKETIRDCVRGWWGNNQNVTIVDPATNSKLAEVARKAATKKHKRFVFHKSTGESRLVESDELSSSLAAREVQLLVN